ncbi:hypothetical protein ACFWOG_32980, partial [Kitasatospora sp. NPDC058406]|uniref:hypothetical protein n=1 Tax=Kitasatospora sp. NPDC058406 TaxID=3346483 RepID=UPI003665888E
MPRVQEGRLAARIDQLDLRADPVQPVMDERTPVRATSPPAPARWPTPDSPICTATCSRSRRAGRDAVPGGRRVLRP